MGRATCAASSGARLGLGRGESPAPPDLTLPPARLPGPLSSSTSVHPVGTSFRLESPRSHSRCPRAGLSAESKAPPTGRLTGLNAIFVFLQAYLSCSEGGELTVVEKSARMARATAEAGRGGAGLDRRVRGAAPLPRQRLRGALVAQPCAGAISSVSAGQCGLAAQAARARVRLRTD